MNGGRQVAEVLRAWGVETLFTLCGGHVSPILVEAKRLGLRVVDVRHEASAVFAADATARLTGRPGVAVVTAGPGVTNSVTAVQNARLAESPVVVLGGATATILKGRGALQEIDQIALMRPIAKAVGRATRVADLVPWLEWALHTARSGVPGPVFLELPLDLLYEQEVVREWYGVDDDAPANLVSRMRRIYLAAHLRRLFAGGRRSTTGSRAVDAPAPGSGGLGRAVRLLSAARRPLLLVGSQAVLRADEVETVASAIRRLGLPCYLSGMARGLLGMADPLQLRHRRREALREADLVLLAGVPLDFRLDYGRRIPRSTRILSVNRSAETLRLNRRPRLGIVADPGTTLVRLAERNPSAVELGEWRVRLTQRDSERETEIAERAAGEVGDGVGPLSLFRRLDALLEPGSVLVADGGDFVATASYVLRPRAPLSWLDPGLFGTLGVGGGFALAARCHHAQSEVWLLWGDGSAGFSLAELDTCVRHGLPVIAIVGNDASWAQIAREQVPLLGDAVGTELRRTDYHRVAEGYGAAGILVERQEEVEPALVEAKRLAAAGTPVLVNVHLAASDFRKGSISV